MTPLSQQQAPRSPLLLFAHGGGLCKEAWEPIIRRLHESPLLQRTPFATHGIDFRYHGLKRDNSIKPRVFSVGPKAQRSIHPINAWVATATQEIVDYVREFKKQHPQTPLIGIGHSMGAVALWLTEISHPGSFDGLILFEPMYGFTKPETSHLQDMLVGATLRREAQWPSREAALRHFAGFKNFASWHKESLAAYLQGALIEEQDGSIALACHPRIEAGIYCGYACWISAEESTQPKCRVSFQGGERSPFFAVDQFEVMKQQSPHIYKIGSAMPKCSHAMVMENPELASQKILEDLAELPVFAQHHAASSSRLPSLLLVLLVCLAAQYHVSEAITIAFRLQSTLDSFHSFSFPALEAHDGAISRSPHAALHARRRALQGSLGADHPPPARVFATEAHTNRHAGHRLPVPRLQARQLGQAARVHCWSSVPTSGSPCERLRVHHNARGDQFVQEFKKQQPKVPLIGIGHSMGAVALWLAEINNPGTFDGLILFEPMYSLTKPENSYLIDMLVAATLRRETQWPSREVALAHLKQFKNFKTWDRESLDSYLEGALVGAQDGSIALACDPQIEAAIHCGYPFWISVEESARPKYRVSFHGGGVSRFFAVDHFAEMRAQSPHIYKIGNVMPECSHAMVMENPELSAQKILEDLAELPVYAQQHHSVASSTTQWPAAAAQDCSVVDFLLMALWLNRLDI